MKPQIQVDLAKQQLRWTGADGEERSFLVSTATNGAGERFGSCCTPRGRHVVRAKIGAAAPSGAVFVGRRYSGEIYNSALALGFPQRDWILTRILWLSGSQVGRNRLGDVDTMRRYIYIHGTPETEPMGVPGSHGCIRMRNDDVVTLFEHTPVGTPVDISEG